MATLGALSSGALAGCTSGGDGEGTDTQMNTATDGGTTSGGGQQTTTQADVSASGTVKVGIMQPMSGDLQYYGMQSIWGFLSGLAYRTDSDPLTDVQTGTRTIEDGDVTWELIFKDTQFSADFAQTAATDLVQQDDVDVLFGCSSSGAASRVAQTVVNTSGVDIPYIAGPAASADITANSDTCSAQVFRANENTAMDARSGGTYAAQETDIQRVFLMGADYSFGRAVVNNYRTVLEANGIEIVGERFVPQGYSEWEGLLDQAEEAGAEGIVAGFTVATLPQLFTTFLNGDYPFRVFGGFATQITTSIVGQTLQRVLGEPLTAEKLSDANFGPFTTRYHWNQYDNEINQAFVESYTDAYGIVPDLFTSGTFTAGSAIVQAVEAGGSTEGADIQGELRGMVVADTPKGEDGYEFQTYNNQARSAMTIADVVPNDEDNWDALIKPSEPVSTVAKGNTTIPSDSSEMGCNL